MAKFESLTAVKRERQSDFGKNTSTEHGMRTIFERFCENGSFEGRSRSGSQTVINQEKVGDVHDFLQTYPGSSRYSVCCRNLFDTTNDNISNYNYDGTFITKAI